MRRQLSVERDFLQERILVVRLQALIDRIQIDFQRLVALQEIGFEELRAHRVAGPGHGIAAQLGRRRQVELFGVAEQIAVVPGGGEIDAQIGGVGEHPDRPHARAVR